MILLCLLGFLCTAIYARNSLGVQWLGLETLQVGLWTHCGHYDHNSEPMSPVCVLKIHSY